LGVQGIANFDIMNPTVFFGLIVGVAIPAVFSAMLMLGVGLKEGKENAKPDYDKCIDIATILVGFIGGTSGLLLALLMSNAGGLWDNSKKYVEAGNCGGKGSTAHKAAVVGDTVGDPFKTTQFFLSRKAFYFLHYRLHKI